MKLTYGALLALAIAAPAAAQPSNQQPSGHAQHQEQGHAQHQGHGGDEQDKGCCKMVDGKMECRMMKGDAARKDSHQGHSAH